jgi:hypothetical protein
MTFTAWVRVRVRVRIRVRVRVRVRVRIKRPGNFRVSGAGLGPVRTEKNGRTTSELAGPASVRSGQKKTAGQLQN